MRKTTASKGFSCASGLRRNVVSFALNSYAVGAGACAGLRAAIVTGRSGSGLAAATCAGGVALGTIEGAAAMGISLTGL